MDNIVITLDIGSTFIKAAVFDVEVEKILYTEKCHTPAKRPDPDPAVFENDAQALLNAVREVVHRCARAYPDAGGLLMSTQQHGCVLCHPGLEADTYISWQDTRCLHTDPETGKSYLEELEELFSLPPEDRAVIIRFYQCECFGQVMAWLNDGMRYDIGKQFRRLCYLGEGMTERMLKRAMEADT